MAFQQGLSGLNVASKAIDATSNNIANSSTAGFKASSVHFADVYAASLSGGGATGVGIGASVGAIFQQFTQGNISTTNNPLDMAINGAGFFRLSQGGGAITYSRNGQFALDKNGYITNDQGFRLTGYPADATGTISASSPQDIQVNASDISPVATGASVGGTFAGVLANINLDARELEPSAAFPAPLAAPGLQSPNPAAYNFSTGLTVYDTLGNPHTMSLYFVKTPNAGEWDVHANVDGTSTGNVEVFALDPLNLTNPPASVGTSATIQFDTSGQLDEAVMPMPLQFSIDLDGIATDLAAAGINRPNNAETTLTFNLDFTGTSQFGSPFGVNRLEQDGYTSGRLSGMSVGNDGVILGRYSNGQTRGLGQVILANFTNPNGLQPLGNNQWAETSDSGPPLVGQPATGALGVIQSAAVEDSNVDLTAELVNMITQQRNYQANAQSIRTQDQILNTLVNLR